MFADGSYNQTKTIRSDAIRTSKRPGVKRVALFPGRTGDKSAEHVASFNEQRDPQAKPAVLQYFGKTAVNNKTQAHLGAR